MAWTAWSRGSIRPRARCTSTQLGAPQDVARYGFESAGIATGGSGVWAVDAAHRGIARLDPASGAVAQRVALPTDARDPSSIGLATAFGIGVVGTDVWIPRVRAACVVTQRMMDCGGFGELLRLDTTRRGRVVSRIPVVNPQDVLVAFDSVWLVASDPRTGHDIVTRFDPATSRVIATVALPGPSVGDCLGACAPLRARASGDSVWVSAADSGALVRIDPGTNRVAATVFFSRALTGVAVGGDGSIWVTAWDPAGPSCDGFVARVDPLALAPVAATPMECPRAVDVAGGDVWVAGRDGVSRLHPAP